MTTHVKVLGVLFIALSALGICAALFVGLAGTALTAFLLAISLPGLIAGIGLLNFKPWARILAIVLCAINLINIPFGTAMGIYGLWALLNKETEALFSGRPPVTTPTTV